MDSSRRTDAILKRTSAVAAALVAACGIMLALAGSAFAYPQVGSLNPLRIWSNGLGQFTADHTNPLSESSASRFFYDSATSESAGNGDAGVNIAVFDWNGPGTAKVFGFRGTPFKNTSVPAV